MGAQGRLAVSARPALLPRSSIISVTMALPMKKAPAMKGARSMKAKRVGKIVSKKASAASRKRYQTSGAKIWAECIKQARKALNLTGFVAINGKQAEGKALYAKSKSLYSEK